MLFGRTKAASAFVRGCQVYVSEQHQVALVAPMVNHAGLFAERPGAVLETSIREAAELGQATRVALEGCLWQPELNGRGRKLTDWPAFQQSGCRSVREFQSAYDAIHVGGANEANLIWEVRSGGIGRFDIGAVGTVSAGSVDSELGQCVLAVWESHRQLRERRAAGPAA